MIDPVMLAVEELREERVPDDLSFGLAQRQWATVVGVTVGDRRSVGWGRGWWGGSGNWTPPWGRHPIPIGVEMLVRVASPLFVENDPRFKGVSRRIVQEEFDVERAADVIRAEVRSIGEIPMEILIDKLSDFSYACDDD